MFHLLDFSLTQLLFLIVNGATVCWSCVLGMQSLTSSVWFQVSSIAYSVGGCFYVALPFQTLIGYIHWQGLLKVMQWILAFHLVLHNMLFVSIIPECIVDLFDGFWLLIAMTRISYFSGFNYVSPSCILNPIWVYMARKLWRVFCPSE
jgi:hypothetical protein